MKKIFAISACALVLTTASAIAQTASDRRVVTRDDVKQYAPGSRAGFEARAAHNQSLYGGNPDAGGGPRGSVQSTNSPNASKEYGGR